MGRGMGKNITAHCMASVCRLDVHPGGHHRDAAAGLRAGAQRMQEARHCAQLSNNISRTYKHKPTHL